MNNDKSGNIFSSLHGKNKIDIIKAFQVLPEKTIDNLRDSFICTIAKNNKLGIVTFNREGYINTVVNLLHPPEVWNK
jgi:hypothetical protein